MNKAAIVRAIIDALRGEFDTLRNTSLKTRAAGGDSESKAEGKYDARSTGDNYLADGRPSAARYSLLAGAARTEEQSARGGKESHFLERA